MSIAVSKGHTKEMPLGTSSESWGFGGYRLAAYSTPFRGMFWSSFGEGVVDLENEGQKRV